MIFVTRSPYIHSYYRADSWFAPSQWETALICNDASHWLDASQELALYYEALRQRRGGAYCLSNQISAYPLVKHAIQHHYDITNVNLNNK